MGAKSTISYNHLLDALKAKMHLPIYPVGPAIPCFELKDSYCVTTGSGSINYFQWLDSQAPGSVLYVSLGSFFSISSKQMDGIASGLRNWRLLGLLLELELIKPSHSSVTTKVTRVSGCFEATSMSETRRGSSLAVKF
ncbi:GLYCOSYLTRANSFERASE [Salix viminalis]|uniref:GLYCOSYLTRANSFERASE n=1 Tax=Salix viminalis TaxID=40686 RepID=A0A9Q0NJK3_SALVM|nr:GLYCOSYLTRANSFERASE [Salix viminalis]